MCHLQVCRHLCIPDSTIGICGWYPVGNCLMGGVEGLSILIFCEKYSKISPFSYYYCHQLLFRSKQRKWSQPAFHHLKPTKRRLTKTSLCLLLRWAASQRLRLLNKSVFSCYLDKDEVRMPLASLIFLYRSLFANKLSHIQRGMFHGIGSNLHKL